MKKQGFTLIELSIVLIIIGLVIGGILAGNELVKQARARTVMGEINNVAAAINTFKLKYNMLPGDIPNATTFWPSGGTGNGNANGIIEYSETVASNGVENVRAWEHLSLSGIIGQKLIYSTTADSNSLMPSKIGNGLWYFGFEGQDVYKYGPINYIVLFNTKLNATDMYSMDLKIDDGKASTGKFLTLLTNPGECVDSGWTGGATANYLLNDPTPNCRLFYVASF